MSTLIFGSFAGSLLGWLMGFLSVFLILLVLVQRGRGGGLTGALGGPGGQSAFGSKAGDTFTIITIVVASIWGFTCAFTMWLLGTHTPTTAMPTTMKAGPGDEFDDEPTSGIVIPKPTGPSGEGLSGIGESTTDNETPSIELTPAETKPDTPAEESTGDTDTATTESTPEAESERTEDSASEADAEKPETNDSDAASETSSTEDGDR